MASVLEPGLTTTTTTYLTPFTSENDRENNFAAPKRRLRRTWSGSAGGGNPLSMFGEQIRMMLSNMRFALPAELDLTTEINAKNRVK